MKKNKITREYIEKIAKELDAKSDKPIGRSSLNKKGINQHWINILIPEGMTQFKKILGLKISRQEENYTKNDLLTEIDRVVSKIKSIPTWIKIRHETGITDKVFIRNFGKKGIYEVFEHYLNWLKNNNSESENIKIVEEYLKKQSKGYLSPESKKQDEFTGVKWPKNPQKKSIGRYLGFRNLIHEPTNEQGVVLLFGMISKELGFFVERIGVEFPDCTAKRNVGKGMQTVEIEFEFKSREYNHPQRGCDIIVCWEDNWGKDCPLDVIELRTEIKKLL